MKLYQYLIPCMVFFGNAYDIHTPTIEGFTPLHCAAMVAEDFVNTSMEDIANEFKEQAEKDRYFDSNKARMAAGLIELGCHLDAEDNKKRTPLWYSEKNKFILPTVHQVMLAAKTKEETLKKYHETKDISLFLNNDYKAALVTLDSYLPKNQKTNKKS